MKTIAWMAVSCLLGFTTLVGCKSQESTTTEPSGGTTVATNDRAEEAAESAEESAKETTRDVGAAVKKAGQSVSNTGVEAKIKNAINLSTTIDNSKSKINVEVTDTQVKLMGKVASRNDSMEAQKLAKANAGNRKVLNQLQVTGK